MTRFHLLMASAAAAMAAASEANNTQNSSYYVFGYGSLLNQFSRIRTLCGLSDMTETELAFMDKFVQLDPEVRRCIDEGKARGLILVRARGVRRGWYARGGLQYQRLPDNFSSEGMDGQALDIAPTYLGAVEDPSASTYAVIYPVTADELAATDERESSSSYSPSWLNMEGLEVVSQNVELPPDAQVRWYAMDPSVAELPTPVQPICQSYVDIFVSGALELQAASSAAGFAANVIASTADWSEHWVNDRLTPYRPFAKNSNAAAITRTLQEATLVEGSHIKRSHLQAIYFPGAQKHAANKTQLIAETVQTSMAPSSGGLVATLAGLATALGAQL